MINFVDALKLATFIVVSLILIGKSKFDFGQKFNLVIGTGVITLIVIFTMIIGNM